MMKPSATMRVRFLTNTEEARNSGSFRKPKPRSTLPCPLYVLATSSSGSTAISSMLVPTMKHARRLHSRSTPPWSTPSFASTRHTTDSGAASLPGLPLLAYRGREDTVELATNHVGSFLVACNRAAWASASHANSRLPMCQSAFSHFPRSRSSLHPSVSLARSSPDAVLTTTQRSLPCGNCTIRVYQRVSPSGESRQSGE